MQDKQRSKGTEKKLHNREKSIVTPFSCLSRIKGDSSLYDEILSRAWLYYRIINWAHVWNIAVSNLTYAGDRSRIQNENVTSVRQQGDIVKSTVVSDIMIWFGFCVLSDVTSINHQYITLILTLAIIIKYYNRRPTVSKHNIGTHNSCTHCAQLTYKHNNIKILFHNNNKIICQRILSVNIFIQKITLVIGS